MPVAGLAIILSVVSLVGLLLIGVLANGALGGGTLLGAALVCVAASAVGAVVIRAVDRRGYAAWHQQHQRILAEILDRVRR